MTNHTPGPWAITCSADNESYRIHMQDDQSAYAVCVVDGFAPFDDNDPDFDMERTGLANAHLISVAPEMLAMLKEVLPMLEGNQHEPSIKDRYKRVKALIEKAGG